MIVKHISAALKHCQQLPHCSSHVLKVALLHCMMFCAGNKTKRYPLEQSRCLASNSDASEDEAIEVRSTCCRCFISLLCCSKRWATRSDELQSKCPIFLSFVRKLFYFLLHNCHQDFTPFFFLPKHSLPICDDERFLRDFAVRKHAYLRSAASEIEAMLQELFVCSTEQSATSNLQNVVHAFQTAHALYWLCCEEGSTARVLSFLDDVNPLVDNFRIHSLMKELSEV